ncbi:MAG TPA: DUF4097 family beta strand repeat-containing protein [Kineosporiaceae bacterium]|nr:DUF4097 family beta strand repeat-containing protein [Kineosporiaceae bacterium]
MALPPEVPAPNPPAGGPVPHPASGGPVPSPPAYPPAGLPGVYRQPGDAGRYPAQDPAGPYPGGPYPAGPLPDPAQGQAPVLLLRLLGFGLVVLMVGLGAGSVITQFFRQTTDVSTALAGSVERVSATTDVGRIRVRRTLPGEPLTIRRTVAWAFRQPTVNVDRQGGSVDVAARCPTAHISFGECTVDLDLAVPPGTAVVVRTSVGDVTVEGIDGDLTVTTSTGNAELRALRSGRVDASTSVGDLRISLLSAPRTVRAHTSTGDVTVAVPADGTAYQVIGRSSVGDRQVRVPTAPSATRSLEVSTSVGSVLVTTAH